LTKKLKQLLEMIADPQMWDEIILENGDHDYVFRHIKASPYFNGPLHERVRWILDEYSDFERGGQ
jgi:hypothetical protein